MTSIVYTPDPKTVPVVTPRESLLRKAIDDALEELVHAQRQHQRVVSQTPGQLSLNNKVEGQPSQVGEGDMRASRERSQKASLRVNEAVLAYVLHHAPLAAHLPFVPPAPGKPSLAFLQGLTAKRYGDGKRESVFVVPFTMQLGTRAFYVGACDGNSFLLAQVPGADAARLAMTDENAITTSVNGHLANKERVFYWSDLQAWLEAPGTVQDDLSIGTLVNIKIDRQRVKKFLADRQPPRGGMVAISPAGDGCSVRLRAEDWSWVQVTMRLGHHYPTGPIFG